MPEPGPIALRCSILKHVPHGFSTRCGGVSEGMFASLNFGNPGELPLDDRDPPENIARNYRRLLGVTGASGRRLVEVHQVHGGGVDVVTRERPRGEGPDPRADAIVTDDPGVVLAVRTADCLPALLASEDGRIVGALHAGWRGVIAGVVQNTLAAMAELGATGVVAAVGPCISGEAFEVGEEVSAELERVFRPETVVVLRRPGWPKPHVDLKRAVFLQLAAAGAAGAQVLPNCTVGEPGLFFSHRRDGGRTGRMAS
ncbi:MAG: peptidoglycan editing factor PgeF, partial [Phycisphaerales bacterium]|nr:peptidoglycan editing factor PgeF [Phycisphaerales bacterium]